MQAWFIAYRLGIEYCLVKAFIVRVFGSRLDDNLAVVVRQLEDGILELTRRDVGLCI